MCQVHLVVPAYSVTAYWRIQLNKYFRAYPMPDVVLGDWRHSGELNGDNCPQEAYIFLR
jgi:hypothetical protein